MSDDGGPERPALPVQELTPITPMAEKALGEMGFDEARVQKLRELTAGFYYGLVKEKLGRLQEDPVLLSEADGKFVARMPNFFNTENSPVGQCGDLSLRWLVALGELGILDGVKTQEGEEVVSVFNSGRTPQFDQAQGHIWPSLGLVDTSKLETGTIREATLSEVVFDPSKQVIALADEIGYKDSHKLLNPEPSQLEEFVDLEVGVVNVVGNRIENFEVSTIVVGQSEKGESVYAIGFVEVRSEGGVPGGNSIRPCLRIIDEEGVSSTLLVHSGGEYSVLDGMPEAKYSGEIMLLCRQLGGFEFENG